MQGVDGFGLLPDGKKIKNNGIYLGDQSFNGGRKKGRLDELLEVGMVWTLVKEYGFWTDHHLFACRVCGFEKMRFRHQNDLCYLWARYHHTWTSQYMTLEHVSMPILTFGEESVGILCVEVEGFTDIWPTH